MLKKTIIMGVVVATLGGLSCEARAADYNDQTSCAAINDDSVPVQPIFQYMMRALAFIDGQYIARGDKGIIDALSDSGRRSTAAMIATHCKLNPTDSVHDAVDFTYLGMRRMEETLGAIPPPHPDYSETSGEWTIIGKILDKGASVGCHMERPSVDGEASVGFMNIISARSDTALSNQTIMATIDMEEGSKITMVLRFDINPPVTLHGVVQSGYAIADIGENTSIKEFARRLSMLQNSKRLTVAISTPGQKSQTISIDLSGAREAFNKNGICMKIAVDKAVELSKSGKFIPDLR